MAAAPVPLRVTECGEPEAESLNVREALRAPAALGVKVTATVQLLPAARLLPQVLLLTTKSPTFVPVTAMLLIESAALPVFDNVIVCAALVVPTFWLPKFRVAGLSAATAPVPIPVRTTD